MCIGSVACLCVSVHCLHTPVGCLTLTKSSVGPRDLQSPQKKRLGVHITHPNPPAGTWATAAFRKAPWAPAACGDKGLPPGATSSWHPRSSAGEPGRSGRRWKSAEDRAPAGGPRLPQDWGHRRVEKGLPEQNPSLFAPLSPSQTGDYNIKM